MKLTVFVLGMLTLGILMHASMVTCNLSEDDPDSVHHMFYDAVKSIQADNSINSDEKYESLGYLLESLFILDTQRATMREKERDAKKRIHDQKLKTFLRNKSGQKFMYDFHTVRY